MLQKLTSPAREFGFLPGIVYLIDRALARISPDLRLFFYELVVQPIPESPLVREGLIKYFSAMEIVRGDPHISMMPVSQDVIESRFDQNATCLGLFRQDVFIGYIWLAFGSYQEDEARLTYHLTPGSSSAFDFDLYIFPEHRTGLGFIALWERTNELLRSRGIRFTYSRIARFNTASRKAHQRLGARCTGRTFILKAWPLELMIADLQPFAGFTARKSASIHLELHPDVLFSRDENTHGQT